MKRLSLPLYALAFGLVLTSCQNTETSKTTKKADVAKKSEIAQVYKVDTNESYLEWEGAKPAGKHFGKLKLKNGEISVLNDTLEAGEFTIDMASITVEDLTGSDREDLEMHLKGTAEGKEDHFFDVNKHPEANFEITEVNKENSAYKINGNLTIKGETKNISFPVDLSFDDKKKTLKLSTNDITIDRTEWGINFMSKSIMDNVKDKFINDEIKIKFALKAHQ
ncbi:MAG: YceI family protein [Psychroflexus sp.]|nr:YceI family protein [Psychroflexus sp.]MDN6309115.1 YceI family protein [Psychroflexus sp.]